MKTVLILMAAALAGVFLPNMFSVSRWILPQWTLLVVMIAAIRRPGYPALKTAVVAGLMVDLLSGGRLGIFALSYMAAAGIISSMQRMVDQKSPASMCIMIFLATFVAWLASFLVLDIFGRYPGFFRYMAWARMLPQAAANAMWALVYYQLLPRKRKIFVRFR